MMEVSTPMFSNRYPIPSFVSGSLEDLREVLHPG